MQGRSKVRSNLEVIFKLEIIYTCTYVCRYSFVVQSTTSMQSMLLLGGLGAWPQENFESYLL